MATPLRVLIIEDSEPDAELLLRELQDGGYDPEYEIVDTPEAMSETLGRDSWDVIIADYVMPHFSGLDALALAQDRAVDVPFVMVSGKISEDIAIETMQAGAQDYILKNNLHRLVPVIKREVRDYRRRQRASEARKQIEEALRIAYEEQEQRIRERTEELVKANSMLSREISERKRVEDALRESEERYRTLFEAIDEGFCIIEVVFDRNEKPIDYHFLEVNPAFEKQTGLADAQGKTVRELLPALEDYWFETFGKVVITGQPIRFVNRAEQLHRWYDVYAFRFGSAEKRQVAILFNDITPRMQAEQDIEAARAEAELRAREYRSFLANLADGVIVFDITGQLIYNNEAAKEIFGIPRDESLPAKLENYTRYDLDGNLIPVEKGPTYMALHGQTTKDVRHRVIIPGGYEAIISASASPIYDAEDMVTGATFVFRDVKWRIELEQHQKDLFDREHHIAQVLQNTLFPQIDTVQIDGFKAVLKYVPASEEAEVGGDFYDIFKLNEHKIGIVIGDIAGKGLEAAALVSAAKHSIRSYSYLLDRPGQVMTVSNEAMVRTDRSGGLETNLLTALFAVLDLKSAEITYVSAGHDPPMIRHEDGTVEMFETGGTALGVVPQQKYPEYSRHIKTGDIVVMYTDGITEARRSQNLFFGLEGITEYLSKNPDVPLEDIPTGIFEAALAHAEGKMHDDAAIVAFEYRAH